MAHCLPKSPAALARVATLVVLAFPRTAAAHDVTMMVVDAEFPDGGMYRFTLHYDADALMAGSRPEHMSEEDYAGLRSLPRAEWERKVAELRRYFLIRTRVAFDGARVDPRVSFPKIDDRATSAPAAGNALPGSIIHLSGRIPDGARTFTFWASRSFGNIHLRIQRPGDEVPGVLLLDVAAESAPIEWAGPLPVESRAKVAWQYLVLGFEHILPKGLDHILFVLGLFLLSTRLAPLLWQVTAFTLAHTITLALSMYGVVSLPASIVEPLIALSIAYVAIENVATGRLHAWRPVVVFGFGLLHGLGFAGVLTELGLPRERFAVALVSFNAGVELGQLAVIALAFAAVGRLSARPWYRLRVTVPASLAIAAVGLYWTVERCL